jgi:hypothetical protein
VFAGANAFDRGALGTAALDPFVRFPHPCSDHKPAVGAVTLLP